MAKKAAWHGIGRKVYHNNSLCTEGNNIETKNIVKGTGGNPLCSHCERLNTAKK